MTGMPNRSPSDFSTCGEGNMSGGKNVTLDEIDFAAILNGDGLNATGQQAVVDLRKIFGRGLLPSRSKRPASTASFGPRGVMPGGDGLRASDNLSKHSAI
jgi:hypothetical protein